MADMTIQDIIKALKAEINVSPIRICAFYKQIIDYLRKLEAYENADLIERHEPIKEIKNAIQEISHSNTINNPTELITMLQFVSEGIRLTPTFNPERQKKKYYNCVDCYSYTNKAECSACVDGSRWCGIERQVDNE